MKYFGILVVVALLLFVFVANFSEIESRFQCSGEISSEGGSRPTTIYMKLKEYRWWVGLWSESDGNLWIETPRGVDFYARIIGYGDQLQISDFQNIKGHFSTLSKTLTISTHVGMFEGTCKRLDR